MFTSPEDPFTALPRLRSRESRSQGLLKGYYRMAGNQVRFSYVDYRPPTKLREGNVFTGVCHSVHGGRRHTSFCFLSAI